MSVRKELARCEAKVECRMQKVRLWSAFTKLEQLKWLTQKQHFDTRIGDYVIRWVGKGRGIGLLVHAVDEKSVHHVAYTTLAGGDDQAEGEDGKQCTATVSQQGH